MLSPHVWRARSSILFCDLDIIVFNCGYIIFPLLGGNISWLLRPCTPITSGGIAQITGLGLTAAWCRAKVLHSQDPRHFVPGNRLTMGEATGKAMNASCQNDAKAVCFEPQGISVYVPDSSWFPALLQLSDFVLLTAVCMLLQQPAQDSSHKVSVTPSHNFASGKLLVLELQAMPCHAYTR